MPTKKQASRSIKKDIATAIDTLPEMIVHEMKRVPPPPHIQSKMLLWSGVAAVTALVFGMWLWNARVMVSDVIGKKSQEGALFGEATSDINAIFKNFSKETEQTSVKRSLQEALTQEAKKENREFEVKAALRAVLGEKVNERTASDTKK